MHPMITAPQLRRVLTKGNAYRLSEAALNLLALLHEHGGVTMTVAARELESSTATLTGLADRLEHLGFAKRIHTRSEGDRRKVKLEITPRGCAAIEDILAAASTERPAAVPPVPATSVLVPV